MTLEQWKALVGTWEALDALDLARHRQQLAEPNGTKAEKDALRVEVIRADGFLLAAVSGTRNAFGHVPQVLLPMGEVSRG